MGSRSSGGAVTAAALAAGTVGAFVKADIWAGLGLAAITTFTSPRAMPRMSPGVASIRYVAPPWRVTRTSSRTGSPDVLCPATRSIVVRSPFVTLTRRPSSRLVGSPVQSEDGSRDDVQLVLESADPVRSPTATHG